MFELETLIQIFQTYGYFAVFAILLLCGFGFPVPEDITLVAGGVIAGLGYANVHIMFAVAMFGVVIGDGVMFTAGRILGERFLRFRLVARIVTLHRYELVQQKFTRYGKWVIFFARFMPGLRSPIFVVAGVSKRVSYARFFATDGIAALISVPLWIYLGHFGASNLDTLMDLVRHGQTAILTVIGVGVLGIVGYQHLKNKRAKKNNIHKKIAYGNSKVEPADP